MDKLKYAFRFFIKRIYIVSAVFFFLFSVDQTDSLHIWVTDSYYVVPKKWLIFFLGVFYLLFGFLDWILEKQYYSIYTWIKYGNFVLLTFFLVYVTFYDSGAFTDVLGLFVLGFVLLFLLNTIVSMIRNIALGLKK